MSANGGIAGTTPAIPLGATGDDDFTSTTVTARDLFFSPDLPERDAREYLAARTTAHSFLGYLKDNPRVAQDLAQVMSASPSLGEILIRNPEYLHWLQLGLKRTFPLRSTVSWR